MAADPPAEVQEVLAVFETACLDNLRRPAETTKIMVGIGSTALAPKAANELLAPQTGQAWVLQSTVSSGDNAIVTLSDKGTCSVSAGHVDGNAVAQLLEDNFRHSKLRHDTGDGRVSRVYALTHDDKNVDGDTHALIIANQGGATGAAGIILSAVPKKLLVESGTTIPAWPK